MSFERPWLLAVLVAWAALAWRMGRAPRNTLRGPRWRWIVGVELALVCALVLAAAGPRVVRRSTRRTVLLLVDRSRSTDRVADFERRWSQWNAAVTEGMRPDDALGVIAFAGEAETLTRPSSFSRGQWVPWPAAPSRRDDTDLAAAITHALGEVAPDSEGRAVLLSDGEATRGDAREAATLALAAGVPLDVVALRRPALRDVAAVRLRGPDRVEQGQPVDLALVVRAPQPGHGRVELLRDGRRLGVAAATWGAEEDVVHLRDEGATAGLHRYEARLVPDDDAGDEAPGNESASGFVRVSGGARAVLVSGRRTQGGGDAMASALRATGMDVDVVGPDGAPATAAEWGRYDLVVLSDVRARDLDPGAPALLREHVRALGAGLWMVGSDQSFGPGGYGRGPVEEVLPVTLDLRQHRMRGRVALAILIDRSGSMSAPTRDGRTKLELANEGAARSGAMLDAHDLLAIGHVDTETSWTYRMHEADDPDAISRAAHAGGPGGGGIATDVALRDGYAAVRAADATMRHVIVLADGDDAEQSESCEPMVREALRAHVTTSVVAIGRGHDEAHLARIAAAGGGRYYLADDARSLPAIFTEETVLAARNPMREEPFTPRFVRSSELLRGVDPSAVPAVRGYVVTEARPRAELLARALDEDPWIARWNVGAGRSAVCTSDLDGRWTDGFLRWPGSAALIGQMGLWLARGVHDAGVRVAATSDRGRVRIEVDATTATGRWDGALDLDARVVTPSGVTVRVPLEGSGAGRYAAEVDAPVTGTYLVTVLAGDRGVVGVTGAEVMRDAELTGRTGDEALLAELARRTGGRVRTDLRGLWDGPRATHRSERPMERVLLALALMLLLLEVALRRLPTGPRAWWAALRARRGVATEPVREVVAVEGALDAIRARRGAEAVSATERERTMETPVVVSAPTQRPSEAAPTTEATALDDLVSRKRQRAKR